MLTTLGLELPTDPRWVNIAQMQLEDILTDHAYCEQKAASACIAMIVHFPEKQKLVEVMTPVVAEEWGHFQRVLKEMQKRGYTLGRARKDEYVNQLQAFIKQNPETKRGNNDAHFLDRLLLCALIEARSCERFKLLSQHIADHALRKFYHELMVSEAGHYRNFIELAEVYLPAERVRQRWKELLAAEAEILKNLDLRGDRMH
jgi:tRNA 2-(methylsulfanyl)-N6-isopentenyladenosine37 hydroxylase